MGCLTCPLTKRHHHAAAHRAASLKRMQLVYTRRITRSHSQVLWFGFACFSPPRPMTKKKIDQIRYSSLVTWAGLFENMVPFKRTALYCT